MIIGGSESFHCAHSKEYRKEVIKLEQKRFWLTSVDRVEFISWMAFQLLAGQWTQPFLHSSSLYFCNVALSFQYSISFALVGRTSLQPLPGSLCFSPVILCPLFIQRHSAALHSFVTIWKTVFHQNRSSEPFVFFHCWCVVVVVALVPCRNNHNIIHKYRV